MGTVLAPGDAAPEEPEAGPGERHPGARTGRYLLTKLGGAGLSMVFILVLGFFIFRILPGDPVKALTRNRKVPPEQIESLRREFGLDASLWQQFTDYLGNTLTGDLGNSFKYREPVIDIIQRNLWPTILLVGTAQLVAIVIGLWVGQRSAWRRGTRFDRGQTAVALTFWSMPVFWMGMVIIMLFGSGLGPLPGLFPVGGMRDPVREPGTLSAVLDTAHHLTLPCLTLVLAIYAQYALVMRSSLIDEMGNDYLTTARAKGLRDDMVRWRHAIPNALLPTVTLIFMELGFVVSGTISVETVFSWPGLGFLAYNAVKGPDFPLLQGTFLVFSAAVIMMNLFADLLYRFLDPRVRSV